QEQKVKEGALGRKTGHGYYTYEPTPNTSERPNSPVQSGRSTSTVLLTGGTGFLGAYILRELIEKGCRVRPLRPPNTLPILLSPAILAQVEWIPGAILDVTGLEDGMEGVDAVIHSAAKISFSKKDRSLLLHTNIEGTANMVNIALEKKIRRFVYISSVS